MFLLGMGEEEKEPAQIRPQVLVQYPGPGDENEQDIFLFLRPQANNYKTESTVLSIFRSSSEYKKSFWIKYLANFPGGFIERSRLLWKHYAVKIYFAKYGKKCFSKEMQESFEKFYGRDLSSSRVFGSLEAITELSMSSADLFDLYVDKKDILKISGQIIKRIKDKQGKEVFIVNADIPDLLFRKYSNDNCAVIMFRTTLSYYQFNLYIKKIYETLVEKNLVNNPNDDYSEGIRKVFRYSRGPFEQIRDASEFLYTQDGERVDISDMTFARFLHKRGMDYQNIDKFLAYPVGHFSIKDDPTHEHLEEHSLFDFTLYKNYQEAYDALVTLRDQRLTQPGDT